MARDPFARIESQYNFMLPHPYFNPKQSISDITCLALSIYFLQLEQYRKLFGTERLLIFDFDELITDQKSVLSKICRHLNLDDFTVDSERINKFETRHSQVEVTINTSRVLRTLLPGGKLRLRIGQALRRFSGPAVKRRLDERERAIIHELLYNDMQEFRRIYGFPVEKWGF